MNLKRDKTEDPGLELLRTEVAFWRELIGDCDEESSPESIERMQQALALAEKRMSIRQRSTRNGSESENLFPRIIQ